MTIEEEDNLMRIITWSRDRRHRALEVDELIDAERYALARVKIKEARAWSCGGWAELDGLEALLDRLEREYGD